MTIVTFLPLLLTASKTILNCGALPGQTLAPVFQKGHEYSEGQTKHGFFPPRKEVCAFWEVAPQLSLDLVRNEASKPRAGNSLEF